MKNVRRITLFVLFVAALFLLIGDCDDVLYFVVIKIVGLAICGVICRLWTAWKMDDDEVVRFLMDDGLWKGN